LFQLLLCYQIVFHYFAFNDLRLTENLDTGIRVADFIPIVNCVHMQCFPMAPNANKPILFVALGQIFHAWLWITSVKERNFSELRDLGLNSAQILSTILCRTKRA
jgi:hypothetical protein